MFLSLEIIYIICAAAIGLFTGWVIARLKYRADMRRMKKELTRIDQEFKAQSLSLLEISKDYAAAREKSLMLENSRTTMADAFKSISVNVLQESNRSFLDLAQTTLSKYLDSARADLDARGKTIDRLVLPVKDALEKYDHQVMAMERAREKAYGGLTQQVASLAESQHQLQTETGNLAKALRVPHVRGRWGEITLKRVAELSGMQSRCDFIEQPSTRTADGIQRPDMIVHLPKNRQIIIDAKVPLSAYLEALEAGTEPEREDRLLAHAKQVQAHIHSLSQKSYWTSFHPTPEFVVLFIPGENFFSAALTEIPGLIENGVSKGVILATPTTLIALLKTIAYGWQQETAAENARNIIELGRELLERLNLMGDHLNRLGRDLDRSTATYNRVIGSFERRVFASARKFKDLGISLQDNDHLPPIEPAEIRPRTTGTAVEPESEE